MSKPVLPPNHGSRRAPTGAVAYPLTAPSDAMTVRQCIELPLRGAAVSNKTILILAAVILLAAGASLVYQLTAGPLGTSRRLDQLETNLQKWQGQGVAHYEMDVSIRCFCPFGERMPVTVEVLNGEIVSLVDNSGENVPAEDALRKTENIRLMTVDGLFASARKAIEQADSTSVRYDETVGYPISLSIDWWAGTGDDNEGAEVSAFRVLP